jgi:hypothetical protein
MFEAEEEHKRQVIREQEHAKKLQKINKNSKQQKIEESLMKKLF